MISAAKSRKNMYNSIGFKYGIQAPRKFSEELDIYKENENDFREKTIEKKHIKVQLALKFLLKGNKLPPGYQKITGHWVFDVKIYLTSKAQFVVAGYLNKPPQAMTYSSTVSRDTIRILLKKYVLNDLDGRFFNIGNT